MSCSKLKRLFPNSPWYDESSRLVLDLLLTLPEDERIFLGSTSEVTQEWLTSAMKVTRMFKARGILTRFSSPDEEGIRSFTLYYNELSTKRFPETVDWKSPESLIALMCRGHQYRFDKDGNPFCSWMCLPKALTKDHSHQAVPEGPLGKALIKTENIDLNVSGTGVEFKVFIEKGDGSICRIQTGPKGKFLIRSNNMPVGKVDPELQGIFDEILETLKRLLYESCMSLDIEVEVMTPANQVLTSYDEPTVLILQVYDQHKQRFLSRSEQREIFGVLFDDPSVPIRLPLLFVVTSLEEEERLLSSPDLVPGTCPEGFMEGICHHDEEVRPEKEFATREEWLKYLEGKIEKNFFTTEFKRKFLTWMQQHSIVGAGGKEFWCTQALLNGCRLSKIHKEVIPLHLQPLVAKSRECWGNLIGDIFELIKICLIVDLASEDEASIKNVKGKSFRKWDIFKHEYTDGICKLVTCILASLYSSKNVKESLETFSEEDVYQLIHSYLTEEVGKKTRLDRLVQKNSFPGTPLDPKWDGVYFFKKQPQEKDVEVQRIEINGSTLKKKVGDFDATLGDTKELFNSGITGVTDPSFIPGIPPNESILKILRAYASQEYRIIVLTGRPDSSLGRKNLLIWFRRYGIELEDDDLFMRPAEETDPKCFKVNFFKALEKFQIEEAKKIAEKKYEETNAYRKKLHDERVSEFDRVVSDLKDHFEEDLREVLEGVPKEKIENIRKKNVFKLEQVLKKFNKSRKGLPEIKIPGEYIPVDIENFYKDFIDRVVYFNDNEEENRDLSSKTSCVPFHIGSVDRNQVKIFIQMVGPPGTGKTTVCDAMSSILGDDMAITSSDIPLLRNIIRENGGKIPSKGEILNILMGEDIGKRRFESYRRAIRDAMRSGSPIIFLDICGDSQRVKDFEDGNDHILILPEGDEYPSREELIDRTSSRDISKMMERLEDEDDGGGNLSNISTAFGETLGEAIDHKLRTCNATLKKYQEFAESNSNIIIVRAPFRAPIGDFLQEVKDKVLFEIESIQKMTLTADQSLPKIIGYLSGLVPTRDFEVLKGLLPVGLPKYAKVNSVGHITILPPNAGKSYPPEQYEKICSILSGMEVEFEVVGYAIDERGIGFKCVLNDPEFEEMISDIEPIREKVEEAHITYAFKVKPFHVNSVVKEAVEKGTLVLFDEPKTIYVTIVPILFA